jgi:hypothetical protein
MDSNAFFHDLAFGASAEISSTIALLLAAEALANLKLNHSLLEKNIFFGFFGAESYGLVGSRKFTHDLEYFHCSNATGDTCNEPFSVPLPLTPNPNPSLYPNPNPNPGIDSIQKNHTQKHLRSDRSVPNSDSQLPTRHALPPPTNPKPSSPDSSVSDVPRPSECKHKRRSRFAMAKSFGPGTASLRRCFFLFEVVSSLGQY